LDAEESLDAKLFAVERFAFGLAGSDSILDGEALPAVEEVPATEEERGGRSGPLADSVPSLREGRRVLEARVC
jgi:hypothetical protein